MLPPISNIMSGFVDALINEGPELGFLGAYVGGGLAYGYRHTKQAYRDGADLETLNEQIGSADTVREMPREMLLSSYRLGQLGAYFSLCYEEWQDERRQWDAMTRLGRGPRAYAAAHGIDDDTVQDYLEETMGDRATELAEERNSSGVYLPVENAILLPEDFDEATHKHETVHRKRALDPESADFYVHAYPEQYREWVADDLGFDRDAATVVYDDDIADDLDVPRDWTAALVLPQDVYDDVTADLFRDEMLQGHQRTDPDFEELITNYTDNGGALSLITFYGFPLDDVIRADRALKRIDHTYGHDTAALHNALDDIHTLDELEDKADGLPDVTLAEYNHLNGSLLPPYMGGILEKGMDVVGKVKGLR